VSCHVNRITDKGSRTVLHAPNNINITRKGAYSKFHDLPSRSIKERFETKVFRSHSVSS
jgi:hypothetical protein